MAQFRFPYGRDFMTCELSDSRVLGVIESFLHNYKPQKSQFALVREALEHPVGTKTLHELAAGKKHVVLLASDHTRPVPSKVIIPLILEELRRGNPDVSVTILIATGCHRETTRDELIGKFGEEIVRSERIVLHDCDSEDGLIRIGTLPSGGDCVLNRLAVEADLLVSEGFIEPHFFAGFSGGRKSVMPGVAGRTTVLHNHCAEFIDSPFARTGILAHNPIHADMLWAAKAAKLAFIVNVVLNAEKETVFAVAGDAEAAHQSGCEFLSDLCAVRAKPADIAVTSNGGYPLDQNIYQAVKGMTAAEAAVRKGGVIIMLAKSEDGHGGEAFYRQMSDESDLEKTLEQFRRRGRNATEPDQWQSQILIRVLQHAHVIFISDAPDEIVRGLHLIPAHSLKEAFKCAEELLHNPDATVNVIPDGVSVIIEGAQAQ